MNKEKSNFTGNLVVGIFCSDCNAQFDINPISVAGALATNASMWEYIQWVQNSTCSVCKKEER